MASAALIVYRPKSRALPGSLNEETLDLFDDAILSTSIFEEIVGSSEAICRLTAQVMRVAPTDATVLITGESGTGKELIARAIHRRSGRSRRPFISMNCAATPPSLIAADLFGHEKGAFTGANQRRAGRFEVANHGTLFLDEIGDMPAETQVSLLRVLQEREFERIGGNHSIPVDVRVIAATNCDLSAAVGSGEFRRDLFYRLNVSAAEKKNVSMPPLQSAAAAFRGRTELPESWGSGERRWSHGSGNCVLTNTNINSRLSSLAAERPPTVEAR